MTKIFYPHIIKWKIRRELSILRTLVTDEYWINVSALELISKKNELPSDTRQLYVAKE